MATQVDQVPEDGVDGQRSEWRLEAAALSIYRFGRTVADWVVAVLLLIVCAPMLVAIATAIRIDSKGPALFRQQRIGKDGKPFKMMKFRTMRVEAPAYSLKVDEHSPDITRIGAFLRRTGLDELPQLWNVLRGEMAIIGPRPEQVELMDLYQPWQRQRHVIKPGITGWWQIHHRDGLPLHLNVDKDLYYIEHQGLRIDCLILLGTCKIAVGAVTDGFRRRSRSSSVASGEIAILGEVVSIDRVVGAPDSASVSFGAGSTP